MRWPLHPKFSSQWHNDSICSRSDFKTLLSATRTNKLKRPQKLRDTQALRNPSTDEEFRCNMQSEWTNSVYPISQETGDIPESWMQMTPKMCHFFLHGVQPKPGCFIYKPRSCMPSLLLPTHRYPPLTGSAAMEEPIALKVFQGFLVTSIRKKLSLHQQ